MKHTGINELPDLVRIIAPADETHVSGFAVPQHPLQAFQRPTGPQVIFDPELGIRAAFEWRGSWGRAIVDLQDVHIVHPEPLQALLCGAHHMPGNVSQVRIPYLHFGSNDRSELQLLEDTPEVLLRDAIPIVGSVVEVVDAQLDRPLHHAPLFCRATPHHEPRVPTTAKANFRDP